MKEIKLGTCFSIPLENEEYGFGYVNYEGDFLMVSIFDFKSKSSKDIKNSFDKPLLITDWLIDWVVFSNVKSSLYPKWILHRNIILENYKKPQCHYVIFGSEFDKKCLNFITDEVHPASHDEIAKYPQFSTYHVDYYATFVRAKYLGVNFNKVIFDDGKNDYVVL